MYFLFILHEPELYAYKNNKNNKNRKKKDKYKIIYMKINIILYFNLLYPGDFRQAIEANLYLQKCFAFLQVEVKFSPNCNNLWYISRFPV
jgi:hypothetical protein